MRRFAWWVVVIAALVILSRLDRAGRLLVPQSDDYETYHGMTVGVVRVIDGDTIDVDLPDALNDRPFTRVRLWGLDCPETATIDRPAEPWADEAERFVADLLEGANVVLSLEPHRLRGTYGRVLAHADIPGRGSLNVMLLEAGLARADDRWPHKHLQRYAAAERQAKRRKKGLWMEAGPSAAGENPIDGEARPAVVSPGRPTANGGLAR